MKVLDTNEKHVTFNAEDGEQLVVSYDNRGEPYRRGISLSLHEPDQQWKAHVFLEEFEAKQLRDLIDRLFPRR